MGIFSEIASETEKLHWETFLKVQIKQAETLKKAAERDLEKDLVNWYDGQVVALKAVLEEMKK